MSLILSGTDGLSDVDGSAATPAIRGTDANTGIFFPAADTIAFSEGGVEAMRIDSSGNVGIGTSAVGYADVTVLRQATTSTNATLSLVSGTSGYGRLFFGDAQNAAGEYDGFVQYDQGNRLMQFGTAQAERMRIDSSGNLMVGITSTAGSASNTTQMVGGIFSTVSASGISALNATATTLLTLPNVSAACWLISATLPGQGATASYGVVAIVTTQATSSSIATIKTATLATLSMSGLSVQITQSSGGTQANCAYTAMRLF